MTPRQHSDTETRLAGFEARLQDGFAWANEHGREIMVGLGLLILAGAVAAGLFEWRRRSVAEEETELARIEARFTTAMGANPGEYFVPEPANAEQATKAREAALVELDAFVAKHAGSGLAAVAAIKAAELEVDLGKLDLAEARLAKVSESLEPSDPRRAVALRLRGYALDQKGDPMAAAEAYEAGAKIESYPPRALLWISAGDAYARANSPDRAIAAYREALAASPEVAEQERIVQRIGIQQARLDAAPKPEAAAPKPEVAAPKAEAAPTEEAAKP
jgi:predicted negative regulator of RcsB-dependent stress response